MKKKNIILIIIVILLVLIFGGILIYNNQFVNNKELAVTESLITKQSKYEEELITKGYTIDNPNVVLDPYHNSPLTALVMFETEEEVTPTITVHGEDELSTFSHTFESSKIHYLPVYGLYPDIENIVTITYTEDGEEKEKELKIKTEALPEDFILPTSVEADKENLSNDLYFFTPSSKGYTCAYDVNGDVRWYLSSNALWDNARLENGHLLISTERLINSPYYMTGLYEIDLLGKIYQEYRSGTVEDYIVELDRTTGNIVKTFDLKDVLPMEEGKSENWINYDWFHNNSVWYDEATNSITLSGRHQDAVINVDYESGELNWIIGDPTNWSEEYQKYFFTPVGDDFEWQWSQHAAMITPEGYVFILDNGNNKSKVKEEYVSAEDSYTRGVMYKIDTDEMTIEQVWEYGKERGSEFYSPYISDVDYIEKDHYIVHSGGIVYKDGKVQNQPAGLGGADELVSDTVELLNDEVIFEIKLPTNNYRVEKMNVYEVGEYQKRQAKRLGSLGKTEVTKTGFGLSSSTSDLKEIKEEHEIEFTKEEDRLVFTGRFKRGVDVNIVLYQDLFTKVYNVSISKKPYTALCVDIFSEEETENGITVTKYINAEGLSGKYSIYLEVDGTIYDMLCFKKD